MIDSHCHLADDAFEADVGEVIARAREAGVRAALCIVAAERETEQQRALAVGSEWSGLRVATGIHPHQAGQFVGRADEAMAIVRASIETTNARALGEIGLDYHYDFSPREVQQELFRRQIGLAREMGLPIIIHTREAEADTFRILAEEEASQVGGVFHCFTGDAAMAERALAIGFHLSFAGILTFPKAGPLREVASHVPPGRLLVETDAPYLAPIPHRGKRNEPAWVRGVLNMLASVRGEAPETLEQQIDANFDALMGDRGSSRD